MYYQAIVEIDGYYGTLTYKNRQYRLEFPAISESHASPHYKNVIEMFRNTIEQAKARTSIFNKELSQSCKDNWH